MADIGQQPDVPVTPAPDLGTSAVPASESTAEPALSAASPEPAVSSAEEPRKKHGCRGCLIGCGATVGVLLLAGLLLTGWFLDWPTRWGLVESPSEKLFAGSSNPWAAEAIVRDLAKKDIVLKGVSVYVFPGEDGTSFAYLLLSDAEGFKWRWADGGYRSAVEGLLVRTAQTKAVKEYGIDRVVVEHRDEDGVQAAVMTAEVKPLVDYGAGKMTQKQLFKHLSGSADFTGFIGQMGQ